MIEAWSAWVCSAEFLSAWSIIAVAVFCFLFWFPAPYGRHTKVGWGPLISAQLGWIGMEAVTLVGFGLCFFARPDYSPAGLLFVLLYGGHYLYRSFIYPFLSSASAAPVPLVIVLSAFFFNIFNSTILGGWLYVVGPAPETLSLSSASSIGGLILFCSGFAIHFSADRTLRNLRKVNGPGYHIPKGGLYRLVSCPNYLGELLQWTGLAVMVSAPAVWTFVLWTAANLIPRAVRHHRWYRERFSDYPAERRALIPGLL